MSNVKNSLRWLFPSYPVDQLSRVPFWTFTALVVAVVVILSGYRAEMTMIKTVGEDTAPSVELAHKLKASMTHIGADVIDELSARPGQNYDSVKDYRAALVKIETSRVDASHNITFVDNALGLHHEPEGEIGVIKRLEANLDRFIELTTQARLYHERGDAASLASSRELMELLVGEIVTNCDALAAVNQSYLDHALTSSSFVEEMTIGATAGMGIALLLLLVYTQAFIITRKFRVGLSLLFVLATGTTLVGSGFFVWQFIQADRALGVAAADAIPSVVAIQDLRATLETSNALRHIILLDRPYAQQNTALLDTYVQHAGVFGPGQTPDSIATELRKHYSFRDGVPTKISDIPSTVVNGALQAALNNLTFAGEAEAAINVVNSVYQWRAIWTQVQALEAAGQHDNAVRLLSGRNAGQGNFFFAKLTDDAGEEKVTANGGAIGTWVRINRDAQNAAIASARNHLREVEFGVPAMAVIIQLLVFLGTFSLRRSVTPAVIAKRRGLIVEA
jgi:hypothetical protein